LGRGSRAHVIVRGLRGGVAPPPAFARPARRAWGQLREAHSIAVDAEEAWTRNAFEEVEVSSGHREVADALEYLGIGHEMECLTDDEYFSLDLYVPEHDCAIEVDGPTHFVDEIVVRPGGDVGRVARRTTATELRDMFLRKRHGRVVTMPWFELDECDTREERAAYVAGKLRAAGIEL